MTVIRVVLFALFVLQSVNSQAEELIVGLIEGGRPPYYQSSIGAHENGIYIDFLDAIANKTGLKFKYQYMPQSRIRLRMITGRLDIEPGISPRWRQADNEADSSVYSRAFLKTEEAWIYNRKLPVKSLNGENLKTLKACNVHGFNHLEEQKQSAFKVKALSDLQVLELLSVGRCDFSLMPLIVLDYLNRDKVFDIESSDVVARYTLRLRLTKKHSHRIVSINDAITQMIRNGELQNILERYQLADHFSMIGGE